MEAKVEEQLKLFKTSAEDFYNPKGYKGLSRFHKYWGKKPIEGLAFFIQHFTKKGDVVMDPFLGSGLVSKVALDNERKFIGIDVNPISIQLAKLYNNLPSYNALKKGVNCLANRVKEDIYESYKLKDGLTASYYLWEDDKIKSIWNVKRGRERIEREAKDFDYKLFEKYNDYESDIIRPVNFFSNSRINAKKDHKLNDIFTGRALRNIDLLISAIQKEENELVKKALLLILSASSGQMSKMVFAITRRGKNNGKKSERIEVGSWVIGYWKPDLHFEVNVWRTFNNKANKLLRGIKTVHNHRIEDVADKPDPVINGSKPLALINDDSITVLKKLASDKVDLIIADPPHSDRIPYLELSEMWNSILKNEIDFNKEIVVSDAKERNMDQATYKEKMIYFLKESTRVLKKEGLLIIYFNAKSEESWSYLDNFLKVKSKEIKYLGYLPSNYSAKSVVQTNRKGGLKNDYALIFYKGEESDSPKIKFLENLPHFKKEKPLIN